MFFGDHECGKNARKKFNNTHKKWRVNQNVL